MGPAGAVGRVIWSSGECIVVDADRFQAIEAMISKIRPKTSHK